MKALKPYTPLLIILALAVAVFYLGKSNAKRLDK